jgi:hypothetical protein
MESKAQKSLDDLVHSSLCSEKNPSDAFKEYLTKNPLQVKEIGATRDGIFAAAKQLVTDKKVDAVKVLDQVQALVLRNVF